MKKLQNIRESLFKFFTKTKEKVHTKQKHHKQKQK